MRTLLILLLALFVVGAVPEDDVADGVEEKALVIGKVSKRDAMRNEKQKAVFMIVKDLVSKIPERTLR